ncbi:glycoside hydrolase [Mrakia frigida]|uniref:glycoside hydrolase family 47 protein n=1 Tax=Mrakia frigida TaxID=29902 RepID=UPI003FCC1B5D
MRHLLPKTLEDLPSTLRLSRRSLVRSNRTLVLLSFGSISSLLFYLFFLHRHHPSSSSSILPLPPISNPALFNPYLPSNAQANSRIHRLGQDTETQDWASLLPPDSPSLSSLPLGAEWFPLLSSPPPSSPPLFRPFPLANLSQIYPPTPPDLTNRDAPPPNESNRYGQPWPDFAKKWKPPKMGKPWKVAPRVQAEQSAFVKGRNGREELLEGRREVIRNGFLVSWEGYKKRAWGYDEVKPNTGLSSSPFNGWGATIIDSLDTLLLLSLPSEYSLAREHVRLLDFDTISGRSTTKGFLYETGNFGGRSDVLEERYWPSLPVFETTIRYLGGLLSAYDLTGDQLMLDRAEELGKILIPAFETASGIPHGSLKPGRPFGFGTNMRVSLAEAGSMTLEMTRLSQLTGNQTYFNFVQRVTDVIDTRLSPRSSYPPLMPTSFDPDEIDRFKGIFTFGGSADSYYEYLIKQHQLLQGRLPQYARMYTAVMETAYSTIIRMVTSIPGRKLVTIGEIKEGKFEGSLEHLTCFAGAMIGLGARLLNRPGDLDTAKEVTQTCYYMGALTESGLQPEKVIFFAEDDPKQFVNIVDQEGKLLYKTPAGRPMGVKESSPRYIGRPETIESVFYMYRLTGDPIWQDKGWRMFTSWANTTLVEYGFSSVSDVRKVKPSKMDNMESFVLAETLKYHYLLQSPPDLMSLDDYVLNTGRCTTKLNSTFDATRFDSFLFFPSCSFDETEAHPFIANPSIQPGSQGLWDPSIPPSSPLHPEDTSRPLGSGTHAQLWDTHKRVPRFSLTKRPIPPASPVKVQRPIAPLRNGPGVQGLAAGGGGGKKQAVGGGMGGGGGRPRPVP